MIAAAVFAFAALLFASGYLSQREAAIMKVATPTPVAIASRDIAAGEALDDTKLAAAVIPRRFLEPNSISRIEDATGRAAIVPIRAGSQITSSIARLPVEGFGLASLIPAGKRAVSISVPASAAAGGLIRPNDLVDILATFDLGGDASARRTTLDIASAVPVLAVNQRMVAAAEAREDKGNKSGIFSMPSSANKNGQELTITLAVTQSQAQALAFAQESSALAVSLRPVGEDGEEKVQATTMSTIAGGNAELMIPRKGYREYKGR